MKKEIDYKGKNIEEIYKLALIGADFITEKNDNGVTVINSLHKQLYISTVLLTRFLDVVELPDNRVLNLEQYNANNYTIDDFKGRGIKRLKADFDLFIEMLNEEISNTINDKNDALNRLNEAMSEMTPENIENIKKQQDELINELNKLGK